MDATDRQELRRRNTNRRDSKRGVFGVDLDNEANYKAVRKFFKNLEEVQARKSSTKGHHVRFMHNPPLDSQTVLQMRLLLGDDRNRLSFDISRLNSRNKHVISQYDKLFDYKYQHGKLKKAGLWKTLWKK